MVLQKEWGFNEPVRVRVKMMNLWPYRVGLRKTWGNKWPYAIGLRTMWGNVMALVKEVQENVRKYKCALMV
jgi:hypothetical protein